MNVQDLNPDQLTNLQASGYTADDLALLAPSEVEALLGSQRADTTTEDDPHEAAAQRQAQQQTAADGNDAADAGKAAAQATADADADQAKPQREVIRYDVSVPADAEDKIKELRGEDKAAFQRLMDGEIDAEEYQAVKDRVDGEVDKLRSKVLTAQVLEQANAQHEQQAAENEWKTAEHAAFADFKGDGLDYKAKPALLAAYNVHLKALGSDPKNEQRDADWFLREAHKQVCADLGITPKQKQRANPPAGVDFAELPPTLRSAPAAASSAINADEFTHLSNLDGLALERAVAALTDAQRERWLNS